MTTFLGSVQRFSDFIVSMFGDGHAVAALALMLALAIGLVGGITEVIMRARAFHRRRRVERVIAAATGRRQAPRGPGPKGSARRVG